VDVDNGIEWLDWSLTLDRTYTDVFGETQGGTLDGWRYATEADFLNLAASAGVPGAYIDAISTLGEPSLAALNVLFGDASIVGESFALFDVSLSAGSHATGGIRNTHDLFENPNAPPNLVQLDPLQSMSSVSLPRIDSKRRK
jgi:hypothetical protein